MPDTLGYVRFTDYLLSASQRTLTLSFSDIEGVIGDRLPPSAYEHEAWWSNSPSHPLAKAWRAAGWRRPRGGINLQEQRVTLERLASPLSSNGVSPVAVEASEPCAPTASPVQSHASVDALPSAGAYVSIEVERDEHGAVREYEPQADYANTEGLPLNQYGSGSFCRFRVPTGMNRAGIYFIMAGERVMYIGECEDFSQRFNAGYGQISPRNCFKGGQETNCRVNRLIRECVEAGGDVSVFFLEARRRQELERCLLESCKPPWNRT